MSVTYNLKDNEQYKEFFDMIVEDIKDENDIDEQGFPLDEFDEPISIDWLWDNYGHMLDGTQTGLGQQLFSEVIAYFNHWVEPITNQRREEIQTMAKDDWMVAYEAGQVNPDDDCDPKLLVEAGLTTKAEQDTYITTYCNLVG